MKNHPHHVVVVLVIRLTVIFLFIAAVGICHALALQDPARGDSIRAGVESILRAQEAAWNRADIDAFMRHYWNSDDLTFSSGGKTTRGWKQTLDRYRQRYPTPEKMGRVTFSELEITPLGDSAALVLGQWNLKRETEPLSGNFSLVVRKFDNRWLIIHDHTSQKTD